MMVRAYLEWSLNASAQERAEAVGILADVFLQGELAPEVKRDAEAALMLALDDPAPAVRRMLAERLGAADHAPRPLISALAQDRPDIAAIVIANSPLIGDGALVDLLALGDAPVQIAIAERAEVGPAVAAALAEVGMPTAVQALLANPGAALPLFALQRIVQRFPEDGAMRETLIERDDLPAEMRIALVQSAARQLAAFAESCGWLTAARATRLAQDCAESGAVRVAAEAVPAELGDTVRALRGSGALTPQLLLRSLLSGDTGLLAAALAELAGVAPSKAAGLLAARHGAGFRALYRKAGLPDRLEPAFEAALSAWHEIGPDEAGRLSRRMVERVLTSVAALDDRELDGLMALLARYQAEAARDEARVAVAAMLADAAPAVELEGGDLERRLADALLVEFKAAA